MASLIIYGYSEFGGKLVDRDFSRDLFYSDIYSPDDPHQARDGRPHVMMTLANGLKSHKDCLYRPEILLVLAVMISRFRKESPKDHKIIPVCDIY